jgi:hypothetical protein
VKPLFLPWCAPLFALALAGCSSAETTPPGPQIPDRTPGDRSPLTASCDAMDPVRCLLPWPSSTFLAKDATSATGVRVALDPKAFAGRDDPRSVNRADGFSRVTPLVTAFTTRLAMPASILGAGTPVRLFLAQASSPRFGEEVPLRLRIEENDGEDGGPQSFVFAYPLHPLDAGADYVAVVMDDLKAEGGAALARNPLVTFALGIAAPVSTDEAAFAAYHAPTRAALQKAGVDVARVLRVWDFTTRSADDATRRLKAMRAGVIAAVNKDEATVIIDSVVVPPSGSGPIAAIVEGRLSGLPSYVDSAGLTLDEKGLPVPIGKRDAPFRVVVPAGKGDYRFVMYGHGTGGNFHDATFDTEIATFGVGKVGIQFDGWTDKEVLDTFISLGHMFQGTEHSTSGLMQSLADGAGIEASVTGALGAALSAPMLGNQPNPAAGRHLDDTIPIWAGGSLGGTMGLVYASADPAMKHGVLNVPGGGWTHFIPGSVIVSMLGPLLQSNFGGPLDLSHALAMSQGNWDDVDGAVWAGDLAAKKQVFLIQESIGDPVLENPGSELLAVTTGAVQVGKVLVPIAGVKPVSEADDQSGITQYHVTATDPFDIHGFAARDTPAGIAARDQITTFVQSVWAGKPVVKVPVGCPGGSCDFTGK